VVFVGNLVCGCSYVFVMTKLYLAYMVW